MSGVKVFSLWLYFLVLTGQIDESVLENVKQVELRVPWSTSLQCVWSFSDYRLFCLPARLLGYRLQTAPSVWMLSVCLAEIEKHKGTQSYTCVFSARIKSEVVLSTGQSFSLFCCVIRGWSHHSADQHHRPV